MDKLLLPPPLASDDRFSLLAELAATRLSQIDITALLVYLVDLVDASALPALAEQFHVMGLEGWLFAQNEQERRRLIKHAIELHRYKGTPWAVRQVLETLSLPGTLSEWFEYGGRPYHFKLEIELSTYGIDEQTFNALVSLIHEYKNVRSKLESLLVWLTNKSQIPTIGCGLISGETITVLPYQQSDIEQSQLLHISAGCWGTEIVSIYPEQS